MYTFELCRQYQQALRKGSLSEILALFEPEATVVTPLSGELGVRAFHERLFRNTQDSIVRLINMFEGLTEKPAVALQLRHTWVLRNGKSIDFDCISIFEFAPHLQKINKLTLVYDSACVRKYLDQAEVESLAGI